MRRHERSPNPNPDHDRELRAALWMFALLGKPQQDLLEQYLEQWPVEFRARVRA